MDQPAQALQVPGIQPLSLSPTYNNKASISTCTFFWCVCVCVLGVDIKEPVDRGNVVINY